MTTLRDLGLTPSDHIICEHCGHSVRVASYPLHLDRYCPKRQMAPRQEILKAREDVKDARRRDIREAMRNR